MLGDRSWFFGVVGIVGLRWFWVINTITTASLTGTTYQINFCVRSSVGPTSRCGQVFTLFLLPIMPPKDPEEKSHWLTLKSETILAQADFNSVCRACEIVQM